jgi:hypothetical protein
MPFYRITPLAPAYLLLLGAALILIAGPSLATRRRHELAVAIGVLAVLSLFFIGSGHSADEQLVRVLVEWLGQPALAVRVPSFEPFMWLLMVSLLAISLAERAAMDRLSALDQARRFILFGAACGVLLAGTYRTLAFALLLFDGTAALFALAANRPRHAVGRLLLGVLSSTTVIVLAMGSDYLTAHPHSLGALFSLTIWLRLGLYPLVEAEASPKSLPTMRLGWITVNLAVGLYLVSTDIAPWLAWLAGVTTALHGALAWLERGQERALTHAGHALAGGILTMAAAVNNTPGVVMASMSTLAGLVTLGLTSPWLGRSNGNRLLDVWAHLPTLLATASLVGVPFTLGWEGRGALYRATWEAGLPGTLALVVVAEGAALSVLYRYWWRLLRSMPAEAEHDVSAKGEIPVADEAPARPSQKARSSPEKGGRGQGKSRVWYLLAATLAGIPFLIPVLGPRLLVGAPSSFVVGPALLSTSLGLIGSLLWAFFLGYGRHRLLDSLPFSRPGLMSLLRLGWLLHSLRYALDTLGRALLRTRAIIEGEHYLAWALLLALGLGLMILLR